jgi:hypothetical protein
MQFSARGVTEEVWAVQTTRFAIIALLRISNQVLVKQRDR